MRQHTDNNKIIYFVYFMCDTFQYKFNFESFFLYLIKSILIFNRFLIIIDKKYSHSIYFKFGLTGLKSAATLWRLGNRTTVAILLFFPGPQNDLLLFDLIMKTTSYSRETSSLITHSTYTFTRS